MLGYDPTNSVATSRSEYGDVSEDFILDDLHCNGNETNIFLCSRRLGENCGPSEGAGVICETTTGCLVN